jgi:DNA-binding transcriptional ArsR family regulator
MTRIGLSATDIDHLPTAGGGDPLDALLGTSRAMLLRDLARPRTTSELASRHGLAGGTVSEHLSILARALLVRAERHGRRVYYGQTRLGASLVEAHHGRR